MPFGGLWHIGCFRESREIHRKSHTKKTPQKLHEVTNILFPNAPNGPIFSLEKVFINIYNFKEPILKILIFWQFLANQRSKFHVFFNFSRNFMKFWPLNGQKLPKNQNFQNQLFEVVDIYKNFLQTENGPIWSIWKQNICNFV